MGSENRGKGRERTTTNLVGNVVGYDNDVPPARALGRVKAKAPSNHPNGVLADRMVSHLAHTLGGTGVGEKLPGFPKYLGILNWFRLRLVLRSFAAFLCVVAPDVLEGLVE